MQLHYSSMCYLVFNNTTPPPPKKKKKKKKNNANAYLTTSWDSKKLYPSNFWQYLSASFNSLSFDVSYRTDITCQMQKITADVEPIALLRLDSDSTPTALQWPLKCDDCAHANMTAV